MASYLFVGATPVDFAGDGTFAGFRAEPSQQVDADDHPGVDFTADPFNRYFDPVTDGTPVPPQEQ